METEITQLTKGDLQLVVSRIPKDVRKMMAERPLFIGGGFIRETITGNDVNDIDMFAADKDTLATAAQYLASGRDGGKTHTTDNAITVIAHPRIPVQFITRWLFSEASDLVRSFDFTVCQSAVWFDLKTKMWRSAIGAGFYPDLAARRLVYTHPVREEEAGGSMLRVRKFLARGYNIQAMSLAGVIARIALSANVLTKGDMEIDEQSATYAISRRLFEVDPLLLIDGFEPVDEHEIIAGAN